MPNTASPCWNRDCQQVGALGQLWEAWRGIVPSTSSLRWSRVLAPGLVLSLGAKVDSKQTPSQGKASSEREKDGLLQSNGNTICVLDRMRESAPPRPKSDLENKPK